MNGRIGKQDCIYRPQANLYTINPSRHPRPVRPAAPSTIRNTAVSADYPRDLIGYGNNPPHPHWPGDARIACRLVLNYEEGGERCVLHGDKESEAFLSRWWLPSPCRACAT